MQNNWPIKPYCYSNACFECGTSNSDCTANYGQGSTCRTSDHTCLCRAKGPSNLLVNPGFESDMSGWAPFDCSSCPSPLQHWEAGPDSDADHCPKSGAVHGTYYGFAFSSVGQCVRATPNTVYRLGYRYKQQGSDPDALQCVIVNYTGNTAGTSCSGDPLSGFAVTSGTAAPLDTWASKSATFTTEADTNSILVQCGTAGLYDGWIDQIYLDTQASGGYY